MKCPICGTEHELGFLRTECSDVLLARIAKLEAVSEAAELVKADDEEVDTKMSSVKKLIAALDVLKNTA
ncbi:MAG: hypothetical protein NUV80_01955 [Candidatus Berkelbacteria bacterium]|nr:hypothetical protein [Candidatus Berkelbacteria bacterium]